MCYGDSSYRRSRPTIDRIATNCYTILRQQGKFLYYVFSSEGHVFRLKDFSIDKFAEDCSTLNAAEWNGLTGIKVICSRKILEICFATAESMASLQRNDLNTHGRLTTSYLCHLLEHSIGNAVDAVLQKYGTIKHAFQSKRMIKDRNVRTGARECTISS